MGVWISFWSIFVRSCCTNCETICIVEWRTPVYSGGTHTYVQWGYTHVQWWYAQSLAKYLSLCASVVPYCQTLSQAAEQRYLQEHLRQNRPYSLFTLVIIITYIYEEFRYNRAEGTASHARITLRV